VSARWHEPQPSGRKGSGGAQGSVVGTVRSETIGFVRTVVWLRGWSHGEPMVASWAHTRFVTICRLRPDPRLSKGRARRTLSGEISDKATRRLDLGRPNRTYRARSSGSGDGCCLVVVVAQCLWTRTRAGESTGCCQPARSTRGCQGAHEAVSRRGTRVAGAVRPNQYSARGL